DETHSQGCPEGKAETTKNTRLGVLHGLYGKARADALLRTPLFPQEQHQNHEHRDQEELPAGDRPAVQAAQSLDLAIRPFERGISERAERFSIEIEALYRQSELVADEHVVGPNQESRGIGRSRQRQFGEARALGAQLEDSA